MAKHKSQPKQGFKKQAVQTSTASKVIETHAPGKNFSINEKWIPAILSVLVFVSYIPIWQNSFVWDDKPYITINDIVKNFDIKAIFI